MLKTVKQVWREPGTNTIKAVVEYFINYEIINDKVVKKMATFYVCGPGEFEWCDWRHEYDLDLSNKRPAYKASEAARLVNKYTGLSITYEKIRYIVNDILENLQRQHNHKLFLQKKEQVTEDIQNIITDAIRKIVKKHRVSFNQETDEHRGYDDDYEVTTYSFNGAAYDDDFTVYMENVLAKAYETVKNEQSEC